MLCELNSSWIEIANHFCLGGGCCLRTFGSSVDLININFSLFYFLHFYCNNCWFLRFIRDSRFCCCFFRCCCCSSTHSDQFPLAHRSGDGIWWAEFANAQLRDNWSRPTSTVQCTQLRRGDAQSCGLTDWLTDGLLLIVRCYDRRCCSVFIEWLATIV